MAKKDKNKNKQRKKEIKNIYLFISLGIIIFLLINLIYIKIILPEKQIYKKEIDFNNFLKTNNEINYLFIGDSHTVQGINPRYINNKIYNYGVSGENYIESYFKLKKLIENKNIKIKNIVLELDLQTFSTLLTDKSNRIIDTRFYSKIVGYNKISEIKNETLIKTFLKSSFPSIGKGYDFLYIILKPEIDTFDYGWGNVSNDFSKLNESKKNINSFKLYEKFLVKNNFSNISFKYFLKTIKLINDNNINIIFIKYPNSIYFENILKENNYNKTIYYNKIFKSINLTLKNKYRVLDYYELFFNNTNYFADSMHLNDIGSVILSKRIKEDLN